MLEDLKVVGLVIVFLVCISVLVFVFVIQPLLEKQWKKEEEESNRKADEERKQDILRRLQERVLYEFHVELNTVHTTASQDEIVRLVNLAAFEASKACVAQDKAIRKGDDSPNWTCTVSEKKISWSETKKLALQICPELADHLPHFSEFEPLKSYRAKHIQEKNSKKTAA